MAPQDSHDESQHSLIAVAIIRKPHGVKGEASVELWSDDPDRFEELDRVLIVSPDSKTRREIRIESWRPHGERLLVRFAGITTPEEIRALHDWTVEVPIEQARTLGEDEYFLHDLPGLEMIDDHSGVSLGTVAGVSSGGGGLLLTVQKPDDRQFDVPFASEICRSIDLASRTIRVRLPEGLDDLDAVNAVESEPLGEPDPDENEAPADDLSDVEPFRVDLVTIFPGMFAPLLTEGIIAKGIEKGRLKIRTWDLRDFSTDKHRSTDDEAYGGGAGMVMLAEPVFRCVEAIRADGPAGKSPVVVMTSPQGERFDQPMAGSLAASGWIVILCGRYEGFDERVRQVVDREVSIGDFVVAGGEIPAMLMVEAICRLIEGVVGDRNSVEADSFYNGLLDYPQYTRPAELRGLRVPEILTSGHAEKIRRWKKEQSLRATLEKRPDLLESAELDQEAKQILRALREESAQKT